MRRDARDTAAAACSAMTLALSFGGFAFAGEPSETFPYSGCGVLYLGVECPLFVSVEDNISFSVAVLPPFQIGDSVKVTGEVCIDCPSICQQGPIITLESMEYCPGPYLFDECGTLTLHGPDFQCMVLETTLGGIYLLSEEIPPTFGLGDYVRIRSNEISTPCNTLCGTFDACVGSHIVSTCNQTGFDQCGTLAYAGDTIQCIVLQANDGNTYLLSEEAPPQFSVGDYVRVTATGVSACLSLCGEVTGCLQNSNVQVCGNGFVDACGTITDFSNAPISICANFLTDDGSAYLIDNLGDFRVGDYVHVTGVASQSLCPSCAPIGACIQGNTIELCGSPKFDECGTLITQSGGSVPCTLFQAESGGIYQLQNLDLQFSVGDYVRVTSNEIVKDCPTLCPEVTACLVNNTIETCGTSVDACGSIVDYSGAPFINCINFITDNGDAYFIQNLGDYKVDDRVRVTGVAQNCQPVQCGSVEQCISGNTISACGEVVDECGTLTPSGSLPFFCIAFTADSGKVYDIGNIGGFGLGSRVRVSGVSGAPCFSCEATDGCLSENTIIGCPDINNDGFVNVDDLLSVIDAWGQCVQCPQDLNADGNVDVDDLLTLIGYWDNRG